MHLTTTNATNFNYWATFPNHYYYYPLNFIPPYVLPLLNLPLTISQIQKQFSFVVVTIVITAIAGLILVGRGLRLILQIGEVDNAPYYLRSRLHNVKYHFPSLMVETHHTF